MDKNNIILDLDDPFVTNKEELNFQDIAHDPVARKSKEPDNSQTHVFTNFPNPDDTDEDDSSKLLRENEKQASFWTFKYYQNFFDIDTRQVLYRIIFSMYPNPNIFYLQSHIKTKPDFYGPFWICTTLIISIAISGNLANYFASVSSNQFVWHYDFHKVTIATAVIYAYWLTMPSLLYGLLWWRKNQMGFIFSEFICIYGYSLAIYVPVSVLWLLPFTWLRWTLVILAMLLSACVLVINLWPVLKNDNIKIAGIAIVIIIFMHALLGIAFMMYFFSDSPQSLNVTTTALPPLSNSYNSISTIPTINASQPFSTKKL